MRKRASHGIYGQIEDYFIRNPDEILLIEDICVKWELNRKQARDAVGHIERRGGKLRQVGNEVWGIYA